MTEIKTAEELVERMAEELHGHDWDCEVSLAYNYGTSGLYDEQNEYLKDFYRKEAKQFLPLISGFVEGIENPHNGILNAWRLGFESCRNAIQEALKGEVDVNEIYNLRQR